MKLTPLQKGVPWPTQDPFLFCVHHLGLLLNKTTHYHKLGIFLALTFNIFLNNLSYQLSVRSLFAQLSN